MSEPGTPLPWSLSDYGRIIENAKGDALVMDRGMTEANAVYIVEACNAYPHLVVALRKLVKQAKAKEWDNRFGDSCGFYHVCSQCNRIGYEQHYENCPYAAAIAEAERLLGRMVSDE